MFSTGSILEHVFFYNLSETSNLEPKHNSTKPAITVIEKLLLDTKLRCSRFIHGNDYYGFLMMQIKPKIGCMV
jgi:hypothetical protein